MPAILPLISNKLVYPGGKAALNRAHLAARNCVVAAVPAVQLPSMGGGNLVNLVNSQLGALTNQTCLNVIFGNLGPTVFDPNAGGTSQDPITFTGIFKSGSPGLTMACIFAAKADLSGAAQSIYLMTDHATATNAIGTALTTGYNTLQAFVNSNGIDTGLPINAQSGPFGVPYFAAFSAGVVTGVQVAVLKNLQTGKVYTYGPVNSGFALAPGDGLIYILSRGGARNWNGWVAAASFSNTFLNLPQLRQWAEDPWGLWYG